MPPYGAAASFLRLVGSDAHIAPALETSVFAAGKSNPVQNGNSAGSFADANDGCSASAGA